MKKRFADEKRLIHFILCFVVLALSILLTGVQVQAIPYTLTVLVQTGDTIGGKTSTSITAPSLNDNGDVAFRGTFSDGSSAIILATPDDAAGTVTLVDENPSLTWNYQLTHNSGEVTQWTYTGAAITGASVDGTAAAADWSVQTQTSTQVIFSTTTSLTSGSLTGFHITGTAGGTGTWTAGSNSGSVDGSLPVELSSFTAKTTFDGVVLKWRTESETDNLGFRIYRSANKEGKYKKVAFVDGHGSTPLPNDYTFTDKKAKDGETYYYFLEDIDIAGNTERSAIIKVTFPRILSTAVPTQFALHQNYPNPFNPETWIPYELAADTEVTITIYSSFGHHIRTLELGTQPANSYLVKEKAAYWDGYSNIGERVSSGIYYYHFQAGNFAATKKMIILK